jgi:hypothetical protein
MQECQPTRFELGLINFGKLQLMGGLLLDLRRFQSNPVFPNPSPSPEYLSFFSDLLALSEEVLSYRTEFVCAADLDCFQVLEVYSNNILNLQVKI